MLPDTPSCPPDSPVRSNVVSSAPESFKAPVSRITPETLSRGLPDLWQRIRHPRVLVIGDLILDHYAWGRCDRVSPEAPVLVLRIDREEYQLGGAAGVASLLRGLEAHVSVAGVVGDDGHGRRLYGLLQQVGVDLAKQLVSRDAGRPTTTKSRFIGLASGRHAHQVLRVDHEECQPIEASTEASLLDYLMTRITDYQAVLISDYGKGVCTASLLNRLVHACQQHSIPVVVDPSRTAGYSRYRGASLLKPNRTQAAAASGCDVRSPEDALAAARILLDRTGVNAVLVTLDSEGAVLVSRDQEVQHFASRPRVLHDVTGAGDTVLAVLGLCLASGTSLVTACGIANVAAGVQCERLGVAVIRREDISGELAS